MNEQLEENVEAMDGGEQDVGADALPDDEMLSHEDMSKLYDETFKNTKEGTVIRGKILQVTKDHVVIDVGFKSEGVLSAEEFMSSGGITVQPGDEVDVLLEQVEDSNGQIVLSKEKADRIRVWEKISQAYADNQSVEGVVVSRIKGGLSVDIGIRAFLPGSQVDIHPV